jgi:hypothetical protein
MSARLCKFCREPIQWLFVRFGHDRRRYHFRWVPVSAEADPEGRVVLSNDHWILLRQTATVTVPAENRRRLHSAKLCLDRNDKGEQHEQESRAAPSVAG